MAAPDDSAEQDRPRRRTAALLGAAVLVAALVVALLALTGGEDDGPRVATQPTGTAPAGASAADPLPGDDARERGVSRAVVQSSPEQREAGDMADLREARVLDTACSGERCVVDYTVGVPGVGRIREQQGRILERIYDDPSIERVVLRVSRRNSRDPASQPEETPLGAELVVTRCDAGRRPGTDWSKREGFEILRGICRVQARQREGAQGGPPGGTPPGRAKDRSGD